MDNKTSQQTIPEHKYAAFKWIDFRSFSEEEVTILEKEWAEIPQLDGFDTEGKTCCFKFTSKVPNQESEIFHCKAVNERIANNRMKDLAKMVRKFRYYFNPTKLFSTNLNR